MKDHLRSMSDPELLDAFRRQVAHLARIGQDPYIVLLTWKDQPGIDMDDMIDVLKAQERKQ